MAKYLTQPEEVEAETVGTLLEVARDDWDSLPQWFRKAYEECRILLLSNGSGMHVVCGGGYVYAYPGDWIVLDEEQKMHVHNDQIFRQRYQKVHS